MQKLKYRNPSRACDCGYGCREAVPCCHAWLVSRKLGLDMQTLLHSALAWDTWYSQYHNDEGSIPMPVPVESDILRHKHRANPNLRLPFVQKAKKGRPRKHKRIVSVFEQVVNGARKKSRAQVTCQLCFRTGHNKKSANCPYNIREEEKGPARERQQGEGIRQEEGHKVQLMVVVVLLMLLRVLTMAMSTALLQCRLCRLRRSSAQLAAG